MATDRNNRPTGMGVDGNGVIRPILIESVTGYLLISVGYTSDTPTDGYRPKIDANTNPTDTGIDGDDILSLLIHPDGRLWINDQTP